MKNQQTINPSDYVAHLTPGKFEGESPATEYFYEQMLTGVGETIYDEIESDQHGCYSQAELFTIESEEADAFDIPIGHIFLLWEDNQGFAYGEVYATRSEAVRAFNSKI